MRIRLGQQEMHDRWINAIDKIKFFWENFSINNKIQINLLMVIINRGSKEWLPLPSIYIVQCSGPKECTRTTIYALQLLSCIILHISLDREIGPSMLLGNFPSTPLWHLGITSLQEFYEPFDGSRLYSFHQTSLASWGKCLQYYHNIPYSLSVLINISRMFWHLFENSH